MRRYTVMGCVTVSAYTVVEADTPEEALRIAEERVSDPQIGGWGSGVDPAEVFVVEGADGEVVDLHVEPTP